MRNHRHRSSSLGLTAIGATIIVCSAANAATLHVDGTVSSSGSGLSWGQAYKTIEEAFAAWIAGDVIWVAATTEYTPTQRTDQNDVRSATFLIDSDLNGIKLYGGFVGTETALSQRPPGATTTLSGDIGDEGDRTDNVYHVVKVVEVGPETVFDGFTMIGGYADEPGSPQFLHASGGGMYCYFASPTIIRCRFVRNYALDLGGGLFCTERMPSRKTSGTWSTSRIVPSSAISSGSFGGGLSNDNGAVVVVNCTFVGNQSAGTGQTGGGFAAVEHGASAALINCTFVANAATGVGSSAGGADFDLIEDPDTAPSVIKNCIFRNNSPSQVQLVEQCQFSPPCGMLTMSNCNIEGGVPSGVVDGGGNIDEDEYFVREPSPGTDTYWGTEDDDYGDLRLTSASLSINAGSNAALADAPDVGDLNDNLNFGEATPRDLDVFRKRILPHGGDVDMGAYEFGCNGDIYDNGDCEIDGYDMAELLGQWTGSATYENCPPYLSGDLNEDCKVNGLDIALLLGEYGTCEPCEPEESFISGGSPEDPWYDDFIEWLLEQDWSSFLAWYAAEFG